MIRITDQYFWNFVFILFFVVMVVLGAIILETESRISYTELNFVDYALIALASFRLSRLFTNENTTKWFREQFYDVSVARKKVTLSKPKVGARRTIVDLLSCPWCFSLFATAVITFFYLLTPYAVFPVTLLALAGVASSLQILFTMIDRRAEQIKNQNEIGY